MSTPRLIVGLLAVSCLPAIATAASAVGIDGAFSVTTAGNAHYSIPLALSAGRAGLSPDLTLEYDSSIVGGPFGMGWRLADSVIAPCAKTIAQDGAGRAVRNDLNDEFCLGSQRLIRISAAGPNKSVQYRTEVESFRRVVAITDGNGLPISWDVTSKNGMESIYTGSGLTRSNTSRLWTLTEIHHQGVNNNSIKLSYSSYTGNYVGIPSEDEALESISYSGNFLFGGGAQSAGVQLVNGGGTPITRFSLDGTMVRDVWGVSRIAIRF